LPIEILNAHPVEFTLISHSGIAHQDDDIAEKVEGSPPPGTRLSCFDLPPFRFTVKAKMPPMLLHHFDFGACPIIFHSSALWSIRRNRQ